MVTARKVFYFVVKCLQQLEPPGYLSFGFPETGEPLQRCMVSPDGQSG